MHAKKYNRTGMHVDQTWCLIKSPKERETYNKFITVKKPIKSERKVK